jgi:hypothetical protein
MFEETQVLNALAMEFICQLDNNLKDYLVEILDRSGNFQIFCTSLIKLNRRGEFGTFLSWDTRSGCVGLG